MAFEQQHIMHIITWLILGTEHIYFRFKIYTFYRSTTLPPSLDGFSDILTGSHFRIAWTIHIF
uniref:Uncharacterized protein n=1 Tax=Oryza brachyantha TaxID=4533 RepID=J3LBN2_ORYBR